VPTSPADFNRRRSLLSRIPVLGVLFCNSSPGLAAAESKAIGLVPQMAVVLKAVEAIDPRVGTVVAIASGEPLPKDLWLPCDGKSYPKSDFLELSALLGAPSAGESFRVPDLSGRVLRGVAASEHPSGTGGADSTPVMKTGSTGHKHSLPNFTGLVTDGLPPGVPNTAPRQETLIWNENAWQRSDFWNNPNAGVNEGQHYHVLGGDTGEEIAHTHSIPSLACVPSYVAVRFYIKARRVFEVVKAD
jgi:microcystin-dependent protein